MGTVQNVFYSTMTLFLILWSCWFRSRRTKKILVATAPLSFLMVDVYKIFFTQISSCIKVFNLGGKSGAPIFHI